MMRCWVVPTFTVCCCLSTISTIGAFRVSVSLPSLKESVKRRSHNGHRGVVVLHLSQNNDGGHYPINDDDGDNAGKVSLLTTTRHNERRLSSRRDFLTGLTTAPTMVLLGLGGNPDKASAAFNNKVAGGLTAKIRSIALVMDELQRDLMQERWDLVETYPAKLRSYVPVFTTYTDSAFPTDEPTDKALRVGLRYEVGRFFASLERLRQATSRRSLDDAYLAYSEMALHYDRYLHTGDLYTYDDPLISTEPLYQGFKDTELVYADPKKDPAEVRDLIVLVKGPDKGKTGIVIGIYRDGSNSCVVKLDKYRSKYGIREIRVVPTVWVGKRLGEQDPDEVFLIPRNGAAAAGAKKKA